MDGPRLPLNCEALAPSFPLDLASGAPTELLTSHSTPPLRPVPGEAVLRAGHRGGSAMGVGVGSPQLRAANSEYKKRRRARPEVKDPCVIEIHEIAILCDIHETRPA